MPVQVVSDSKGCFARWGQEGKKYYYKCGSVLSKNRAKAKAREQGLAIGEYNFTQQVIKAFNFLFYDNRDSQ